MHKLQDKWQNVRRRSRSGQILMASDFEDNPHKLVAKSRDMLCGDILPSTPALEFNQFHSLEEEDDEEYRWLLYILLHLPKPVLESLSKDSNILELCANLQVIYNIGNLNHLKWMQEERIKEDKTMCLSVTLMEAILSNRAESCNGLYCIVTTRAPDKTPGSLAKLIKIFRLSDRKVYNCGHDNVKISKICREAKEPHWNQTVVIDVTDLEIQELEILVMRYCDCHHSSPTQSSAILEQENFAFTNWRQDILNKGRRHNSSNDLVGVCHLQMKSLREPGKEYVMNLVSYMGLKKKRIGLFKVKATLVYKEAVNSPTITPNFENFRRLSEPYYDDNCSDDKRLSYPSVDFMRLYRNLYTRVMQYQLKLYHKQSLSEDVIGKCNLLLNLISSMINFLPLHQQIFHVCVIIDLDTSLTSEDSITNHLFLKLRLARSFEKYKSLWSKSLESDSLESADKKFIELFTWYSSIMPQYVKSVLNYLAKLDIPTQYIFPPDEQRLNQLKDDFDLLIDLSLHLNEISNNEANNSVLPMLTRCLKQGIEKAVQIWVRENLPDPTNSTNTIAILHELASLEKLFTLMTSFLDQSSEFHTYLLPINVNYYERVVISFDKEMCYATKSALRSLDEYQMAFKKFQENISQSSTSSLKLHLSLRGFMKKVVEKLSERDMFKLGLTNSTAWFVRAYGYWLESFRSLGNSRLERCLKMSTGFQQVHKKAKISVSVVTVLGIFSRISTEWNEINISDPCYYLMGIVKITDFICDGSCVYAQRLCELLTQTLESDEIPEDYIEDLLDESLPRNFRPSSSQTIPNSRKKMFPKLRLTLSNSNIRKKSPRQSLDKDSSLSIITGPTCTTLNSLHHVVSYLSQLGETMKWQEAVEAVENIDEIALSYQCLNTMNRLVKEARDVVLSFAFDLEKSLAQRLQNGIFEASKKFTQLEPLKPSSIDELLTFLQQTLNQLTERLDSIVKPRLLKQIWISVIDAFAANLKVGEQPEYYTQMEKHMIALSDHFSRKGLQLTDLETEKYFELNKFLQKNSKATETMILAYFNDLCTYEKDKSWRRECYYGSVSVKLALLPESNLLDNCTTVAVKIIDARHLPGMDRSGLSDPYATICLQPKSLFPQCPLQQTKIHSQTVEPEFNETFYFDGVPNDLCNNGGAILHLIFKDHNTLMVDDFLGEVIIPLSEMMKLPDRNLERRHVEIFPLCRPLHINKPKIFKILELRTSTDSAAREFVNSRKWIISQGKNPRNCSTLTNCCSRPSSSLSMDEINDFSPDFDLIDGATSMPDVSLINCWTESKPSPIPSRSNTRRLIDEITDLTELFWRRSSDYLSNCVSKKDNV